MKSMRSVAAMAAAVLAAACVQAPAGEVAVVANVKVLSDKVKDVSSLEAWKASYIKEGIRDEDFLASLTDPAFKEAFKKANNGKFDTADMKKALKVWESIVTYQQQDGPPNEYLEDGANVLDPIKIWNVYGYSFCSVASAEMAALARYAGLKARGWTIYCHCVPEVWWNDSWHMLDASLINWFPKPDGDVASIVEIHKAVQDWLGENPTYKGDAKKLWAFNRADERTGWRKGPALLASCPFYDEAGWWPAKTHGWYSTMQEYDGRSSFESECGYAIGYQVNVMLRPGERLTRNWSHKGLHVNMPGGPPDCARMKPGSEFMHNTPKYGDVANGRVGNGESVYDVTADSALADNAWRYENLAPAPPAAPGVKPVGLRLADPAKPGTLVVRMPTSYIYLTGEANLKAAVGDGGSITVSFSDNNAMDWKEAAKIDKSGDHKLDLSKRVLRRYDYWLKFEFVGKGTGLDSLVLRHDVQHSQRPLPVLGQGDNTITFSAGPQEATITVQGSVNPKVKDQQLVYSDFHPQAENLDGLVPRGASGNVTFPVATPGDMTRLRISVFYRAWSLQDGWDIQVSFDGGKEYKTVKPAATAGRFGAPYVEVTDIPAGTKSALVRLAATQKNTLRLMAFRINADYKLPNSGFRPVRVTYVWEEGGVEKKDVHVAAKPQETYMIQCAEKPTMKSYTVELAPSR